MSELEEIWNELGNIYFKNEAYDEAVRTYQKAIELNRGSGQSYSNLAFIYARQGRYAEAIPMLRKGIEMLQEPGSRAVLWNQLGEAYRKLDDYKNATACYHKAADLDPENTAYQDNLSEAELNDERLAETQPARVHAAPRPRPPAGCSRTRGWSTRPNRLPPPHRKARRWFWAAACSRMPPLRLIPCGMPPIRLSQFHPPAGRRAKPSRMQMRRGYYGWG